MSSVVIGRTVTCTRTFLPAREDRVTRVVVGPDSFGGTLSAVEAAAAIAAGWSDAAPDDDVDVLPLSDGGPGFVAVLAASLGGDRIAVTGTGPFGAAVSAEVLVVGDTAYVEAAQAAGLHL